MDNAYPQPMDVITLYIIYFNMYYCYGMLLLYISLAYSGRYSIIYFHEPHIARIPCLLEAI